MWFEFCVEGTIFLRRININLMNLWYCTWIERHSVSEMDRKIFRHL